MSGGSLDYVCYRIEEIADSIPDMEIKDLCKDFAELMHDLEWWTSGDYSEGEWNKSVHEFRNKWLRGNHKERLKGYVDKATKEMHDQLMDIIGMSFYCKECKYFHPKTDSYYGQCDFHEHYSDHGWERACEKFCSSEFPEEGLECNKPDGDCGIEVLELPVKIFWCLHDFGIYTLNDVAYWIQREGKNCFMNNIRGIGKKSNDEILEKLDKFGLMKENKNVGT